MLQANRLNMDTLDTKIIRNVFQRAITTLEDREVIIIKNNKKRNIENQSFIHTQTRTKGNNRFI